MSSVELVLVFWIVGTFVTVITFTIRCDKLEKRICELEKEKSK